MRTWCQVGVYVGLLIAKNCPEEKYVHESDMHKKKNRSRPSITVRGSLPSSMTGTTTPTTPATCQFSSTFSLA